MGRKPWLAVASAVALTLLVAGAAAGHEGEGEGIAVEPSTVTAGDTVVLAGTGLEPDSERVVVLAGRDLIVEFGTLATDAEGVLQAELTIPDHLPGGLYELRAIGDETLTASLGITAIQGGAVPDPVDGPLEAVVSRERGPLELGAILLLAGLLAVGGGILAWRAERFGGASTV